MANNTIKTVNLLPEVLRSNKNSKFLSSTIDQLLQSPSLERIDGFIGSKLTPTFSASTDSYLKETQDLRRDYQLEPAVVIKQTSGIESVKSYDDLINEIRSLGGNVDDLDRLFRSEFYSFDPSIDWDKFINFQNYYWLPTGPDTIDIFGTRNATISEYTVVDNEINSAWVFTPNGLDEDPIITLYRGNTYIFDISSTSRFFIKTAPSYGTDDVYNINVTNNGVKNGKVTILVDENTPQILYYASDNELYKQGQFIIKNSYEDATINIDTEVVGKKTFLSGTGISLSNGMKVRFGGEVHPDSYKNSTYYVEGVGESIRLINTELLTSSEVFTSQLNDNFEATPFDTYPYDKFRKLPITPEYITISKASKDLNPWTRYNRWVHADVIKVSAAALGKEAVYPASQRAARPIIEFKPDLKLYNFGSVGIKNVDLIDTTTVDVFSSVEGSAGFYVDGVLLDQGHRVLFNADTDLMVRGKIFEVNLVEINGQQRLELNPTDDHYPPYEASVSINFGVANSGKSWWYNGSEWVESQQHLTVNQAPLFDLFDQNGISYSSDYYNSNFKGSKIFSYAIGTGAPDAVLGFPLSYRSSVGVGSYLFKNYTASDEIEITNANQIVKIPAASAFYKLSDRYANVWKSASSYEIPILQLVVNDNATTAVKLTAVTVVESTSISISAFIDGVKISDSKFTLTRINGEYVVLFDFEIPASSTILLKIYTNTPANIDGWYETPKSLNSNPLNQDIDLITLTEASDHYKSMIDRLPNSTVPPRDTADLSNYGSKLIANLNPIVFASLFIGFKEHSLVDAIMVAEAHYSRFKSEFLKKVALTSIQNDPVVAVDTVLRELAIDNDANSMWYLSDMVPFGADKEVRSWVVSDRRNKIYPIASDFSLGKLSTRAVLVYLNGQQLLVGREYQFLENDASIEFLIQVNVGDKIEVHDYYNTSGSYMPATPSKLGMYPKFTPGVISDTTYANGPVDVIQGHDGSLTVCYGDYRDAIILELEKRIFNNIKCEYRSELFDINGYFPGAFRKTDYSLSEVNSILQQDLAKWAGDNNLNYYSNETFDSENPFTWNYSGSADTLFRSEISGSWRAFFKYFYDTDRPHTHPWEMLGIANKPDWWDHTYGAAPYTAGNQPLWSDLEKGIIRFGNNAGTISKYARPGLSQVLPVDDNGNLRRLPDGLVTNYTMSAARSSWKPGDIGPVETAWRRSSNWPFAVQRMLALTKPASYASLMYDPSRMIKAISGQWVFSETGSALRIKDVKLFGNNSTLTNGYSVYISEVGKQKDSNYLSKLASTIAGIDLNLIYKVGGFISKDKLQVIIDAIDPTSTSPGAILPPEDYSLFLNVSNPIKTVSASGVIVQKTSGKYLIKGYDKYSPYFNVLLPIRTRQTPAITIGGVSSKFVEWAPSTDKGSSLTAIDTTTAVSSDAGNFYQTGQIVKYNNRFYRVKVSHKSGEVFDSSLYQSIPTLPIKGGATVQIASIFDTTVTQLPYGTELNTIQEVYDVLIGYGKWLETQGFIFDSYNSDINSLINWELSGKEFLYWTTQNWADNSVITLSPFSNYVKYQLNNTVVDNIFNSFYEYSILRADGLPLSKNNLKISRENSECLVTTKDGNGGIYFIQLNAVQKEHAMVFNNTTVFNDVVYNSVTGYRQQRMKLVGFRTTEWTGDYNSPGFVYDEAYITDWKEYAAYTCGDIVKYNNNYYSAVKNIPGANSFNFSEWVILGEKPVAQLLPNFEYKINQFEDFYSLDIDNFDTAQQKMAQHLTGYTPRVYLNNIFTNPISQYKFYQGFIKEKGTKNAIDRLAKATIHNLQGEIDYTEEWAFRVGNYGAFETYQEIEVPLTEGSFIENPQILKFSEENPGPVDLIYHVTPSEFTITPDDYAASSTFVTSNTTTFKVNVAGYVNFDDVTATAYNEASILDIANNAALNHGDTIWQGFKQNGDWDVLRYTNSKSKVVGVFVSNPGNDITFVTDSYHGITKDSLISVTQFNSQVNGVYKVLSVPALNQITVKSSLTSIMNAELLSPGQLYIFESARSANFDNLPLDSKILSDSIGTTYWVDNELPDGSQYWKVYKKENAYSTSTVTSGFDSENQEFGYAFSKNPTSGLMLVGSPGFVTLMSHGRVFAFDTNTGVAVRKFASDLTHGSYHTATVATLFGNSVAYDNREFNNTGFGLIFASAPGANYVFSTGTVGGIRFATKDVSESSVVSELTEGLVKISSIDPLLIGEVPQTVLLSPYPKQGGKFGEVVHINTATNSLYVSETGGSTGTVYRYSFYTNTDNGVVNDDTHLVTTDNLVIEFKEEITNGSTGFGYSIATSDNGLTVAIGSPYTNSVEIYTGADVLYAQTITGPLNSNFGKAVEISGNAAYLFVSAPDALNENNSLGKVYVYKKQESGYLLDQVLLNPSDALGLKYGNDISVSADQTELVVSSAGKTSNLNIDFSDDDSYFDNNATTFYEVIENFGTAYVYNRISTGSRFVLAGELLSSDSNIDHTGFGHKVQIDGDTVYVAAPGSNADTGAKIHQYTKTSSGARSLSEYRSFDALVDVETIQKVSLVDTALEKVVEYLEVFDPLKGRIPGVADQEIKYKTSFDPAVYSIGTASVVTDTTTSWLDEHVGELWWDLSSVKYVWYEQGSLTYRKNNWGKVFPGATIDVYEWVGSPYLPSEWSTIADTSIGLTEGISGQPKFPDNSVISVKQVYNPTTSSFVNHYYYWVKNKVVVPATSNRRISAYQISSMIANPTAHGLKYVSLLSNDSLSISNVEPMLVGSNIHLNIAYDLSKNKNNRHTEWLILQENSAVSMPNVLLEKKLFDSLLGHDSLGNPVPDPSLTSRTKYGISVRPRQSMFKDRKEALRNLIEYTNSVLKSEQITGNYSFTNLEKKDEIPNSYTGEYDQVVEDNTVLSLIDTTLLKPAALSCLVSNGKITTVQVTEPGYGYINPPTVLVEGINQTATIETKIDAAGRVVSAVIKNSGVGFVSAPVLTVRPYTVIVVSDSTYNNKWAKFTWNQTLKEWIRAGTQRYNTELYWKYIDWAHTSYNPYIDYTYTVDNVYQLDTLEDILAGQYVKVKNIGDNRYVILQKTNENSNGTFGKGYDLIFKQEGTIEISNEVWDTITNDLSYDYLNNFDQTLYDQNPDIELFNILNALKYDIFVNDLKVYWNLFFFKAVKYALTEQKLIDWAFKTSFINVTNYAGLLDQRAVYKLQNSEYYEQYLKEVKPYRTQVRTFTTNYEIFEPSNSHITDFDLPPYYDADLNQVVGIEVTTGSSVLNVDPWKSWSENHLYTVGSIAVGNPGSGYIYPPQVVLQTVDGDTGFGATAEAIISSGKLVAVTVTNPGSGYSKAPRVVLLGGNGAIDFAPAVAYAMLTNGKVRSNLIGIQFNRVAATGSLQQVQATDTYICNGSDNEYVLTWYANPDKSKFTVTLDGELVLSSYFNVVQYEELYNGYRKQFTKLSFVTNVPRNGQILNVVYDKNIELFNAADRIETYYSPTSGMPGSNLEQLMNGVDHPSATVLGLEFSYSSDWDLASYPFGKTAWADTVTDYRTAVVISTSSIGESVFVTNTLTNVSVGDYVNVISTTTNKFSSTTTYVVSVTTGSSNTQVTVNGPLVEELSIGDIIELWKYDVNSSVYDTNIIGGTFVENEFGVDPSDIIVDGDAFISEKVSSGPEELVPGRVIDSFGINVYTKYYEGSPTVVSGSFDVVLNTANRISMPVMPPSYASIFVTYNNRIYSYSPNVPVNLDSPVFTIDWATQELVIGPQSVGGRIGYTIIGVGGGVPSGEIGLIDVKTLTVPSNSTDILVESDAAYTDVKTAYVTVNGIGAIVYNDLYNDPDIVVEGVSLIKSDTSDRAVVKVNGVPYNSSALVQVWFFGTRIKHFNELIQQQVLIGNVSTSSIALSAPPLNIGPEAANTIVELDTGNGYERAVPPFISYYGQITTNTFAIVNGYAGTTPEYVRVFLNGVELTDNVDFIRNDAVVTMTNSLFKETDVVAILCKPNSIADTPMFDIRGDVLNFDRSISNVAVRVTTFSDHDDMLMKTSHFTGNPARQYTLTTKVNNDNYIWVTVNGIPLRKIDFKILSDGYTIEISDNLSTPIDSEVVITVLNDSPLAETLIGYRIFNDIFNRSQFTRLSKKHTTRLANPLLVTDTEIVVEDASVLRPPSLSQSPTTLTVTDENGNPTDIILPNSNKVIPGVILINGERIEFYEVKGNVLSQLRRSTLGTGASASILAGALVIDQSNIQEVPYADTIKTQRILTTSSNSYVISTTTMFTSDNLTGDITVSDGITLQTTNSQLIDVNGNLVGLRLEDQVQVFYGNRLLRKDGVYIHDTSISYDSPVYNILGSVSAPEFLVPADNIGDAYVELGTNKVWVFENSIEQSSFNGYVYKGLQYKLPEFSISISEGVQTINLNIDGGVLENVKLTIVKRESLMDQEWNSIDNGKVVPLINSNTLPAVFLRESPAPEPEFKTSVLTDAAGRPIYNTTGEIREN